MTRPDDAARTRGLVKMGRRGMPSYDDGRVGMGALRRIGKSSRLTASMAQSDRITRGFETSPGKVWGDKMSRIRDFRT